MRVFRPGPTIRSSLLLLALAATLPLFLFSAALLQRAYHDSAALVEETAMVNVRRLALAVDSQLGRAQAVDVALAELPALVEPNEDGFTGAASRALEVAGIDGVAELVGPDGIPVASTLRAPLLGQRPPVTDREATGRVFATGKPQVSGIYTGKITHQQRIAIHTPVIRDGTVRYDAIIALSVRAIAAALAPETLPEGWFAVVGDQDGRTVARSLGGSMEIGQPLSDSFAALSANKQEGFGPALSREGVPILAAFRHLGTANWVVAIGVPEEFVRGPRIRSIMALAGGGGLLLLASLGLAWLLGRGIARPVHALASEAARLGRNELPDPAATRGVAEAEAAGVALREAGELLIARGREREAALRRAEESESRLLLAQEAGQIGAWETDVVTGRRTWSQQQFFLYGVDPAAGPPHGTGWSRLIHPDDRERVQATVARAYGEPTTYQHEFRIVRPNGVVRWVRSAGSSEFRDGKPQRLIGITFDTTDRHESEHSLREGAARLEAEVTARTRELAGSEERFRTYFEYSGDALLVVRVKPDGQFTYETMNRACERLTGLRAHEITGKTPDEVLLPETAASVTDTYRQVVAAGAPLHVQSTLALPSGTLEVASVLVPVRDGPDNRVNRIISGQRDLTEQRRIEGRLSHAQRLEAVGQLTGGVAHDFNNLLTVVVGNLALLRRRLGDDERAARYITSVETAAQRGAKLTASLLAFSRRQRLQVTPIDVGAQLSESATLLRRALGEEIEFSLDIVPGLPLATADAAQLEAAVLNLAINARDAIADAMAQRGVRGGSLKIQVQQALLLPGDLEGNEEAKPGRFVAIQVQDSGIGMTPEVRARAFEPFFTTKEIGQGTGLGLSQVFGFVRQLGGHVTLESTAGHGTRAVLYLPVAPLNQQLASEPASVPAQLPAGGTVLVVEDDDSIREVTSEMLGDAGLLVLAAPNGPAALEILKSSARVDVLFSDVVMPGGATGVDLARAAHRLRPGLAVLLTSGYGGPALSRYGVEGEFEVLAKPYTRTVLLERIANMLAAMLPT